LREVVTLPLAKSENILDTVGPAPAGARRFVERWHRAECIIAVAAFSLIAGLLILDVAGREVLGPIYKWFNIKGTTGIYGAQKLSVYALVLASFCGIGIATATASHLQPRVGYGWIPQAWAPGMDRLADLLTGIFMLIVAYYGFVFVHSTMTTGLRAQAFNIPAWPFQLAIPLGFLSAGVRYFCFAVWPGLRPVPPEFQE
jgi:TRAP-type C4-dicarboxylate transport system permease small subunit